MSPATPKMGWRQAAGEGLSCSVCVCVCVCAAPEPTALMPSLSPGGTRLSGDSGDRGPDPLPLSQLVVKFERSQRQLPRGRELRVSPWGRGVCPMRPVGCWCVSHEARGMGHRCPRVGWMPPSVAGSRWGDAGSTPTASLQLAGGWGLEGSGPQDLLTLSPNLSPPWLDRSPGTWEVRVPHTGLG